jgi:hypothetical protein
LVCFDPSIHFTRSMATMSEHDDMNDATCRVDAVSNQSGIA